jgi:hypothetical protein
MVTAAKDQKTRSIQREMAAEWLRLADAILLPKVGRLADFRRRTLS